jgi:hypothetical protein
MYFSLFYIAKIPLLSQSIPKPPEVPYILFFIRIVAIPAPPPLDLSGPKVPRLPSMVDQSFEIDLLKRSANTDAKFPGE